MANAAGWDSGTVPATAATGVLTLAANANNGETVTLDAKTYTFQTVLTDVDGNVLIGATASDSIDNLVAAITLGAGGGTLYAASTTLHPSVTAAAGVGDTMDVTAKKTGTDGNLIASTETMTSGSFGGATLSGATMWAATDEIVVPSTTTVGMLTNVDWWTNTSPELEIARMNVDGPEVPFTQPIGSTGNPLRLIVDKVNYLGTGELHLDNKIAGGGSSDDVPEYVIDSASAEVCAYLDGMVGAVLVRAGLVHVLASATINSDHTTPSIRGTYSPSAEIVVFGLDLNGAQIVHANMGIIRNARKQASAGSDSNNTFIILGSGARLYQTGVWEVRNRLFIINDGGDIDYAPENDPGSFGPIMQLIGGNTSFGNMVYSLQTARGVIGPYAEVSEGVLDVFVNDPIDLRKDFPL
jgi:hypothetical protein